MHGSFLSQIHDEHMMNISFTVAEWKGKNIELDILIPNVMLSFNVYYTVITVYGIIHTTEVVKLLNRYKFTTIN